MDTKNVLSRFDSIVKSYSKKDTIALAHDLDADGISSGAIAYKAIELLRGKAPDIIITQSHKTPRLLDESVDLLRKKKAQKLMVVDFALDQNQGSIKTLEAMGMQTLVIDHHTDYGAQLTPLTFVLKAQHINKIDP
ncbi:MAG: hypothetical protein NUV67_02235, partial [archaeon]|nr:hypothetical protein [archaeon]